MRIADLVTAYPAVVFTLAAFVYFRPVYPHTLIVVFSSFMWATVARVVRADVVRLRKTEYVEAARELSARPTRGSSPGTCCRTSAGRSSSQRRR